MCKGNPGNVTPRRVEPSWLGRRPSWLLSNRERGVWFLIRFTVTIFAHVFFSFPDYNLETLEKQHKIENNAFVEIYENNSIVGRADSTGVRHLLSVWPSWL